MHSVCVCGEGFSGTLSCPVLLPCVLTATLCDGEDVDESKGSQGQGAAWRQNLSSSIAGWKASSRKQDGRGESVMLR